jgi:hypothetical protein
MIKTRMPGFTASLSVSHEKRHFISQLLFHNADGTIVPAWLCSFLGAACALSLLEPTPFGEAITCSYFVGKCGGRFFA